MVYRGCPVHVVQIATRSLMLVLLILHMIRKIRKGVSHEQLFNVLQSWVHRFKYIMPLMLLSWSSGDENDNIHDSVWFDVVHKDKVIGFIQLTRSEVDARDIYTISSEINTRLIMRFKAIGEEQVVFKNDTLMYSSMFRKTNSRVRVDQKIRFNGSQYLLQDKKGIKTLRVPAVESNLTRMLMEEPRGLSKVFCDRKGENVPIRKVGHNSYKAFIGPGTSSVFHYERGRCTRVEAEGTFYKVEFRINPLKSAQSDMKIVNLNKLKIE